MFGSLRGVRLCGVHVIVTVAVDYHHMLGASRSWHGLRLPSSSVEQAAADNAVVVRCCAVGCQRMPATHTTAHHVHRVAMCCTSSPTCMHASVPGAQQLQTGSHGCEVLPFVLLACAGPAYPEYTTTHLHSTFKLALTCVRVLQLFSHPHVCPYVCGLPSSLVCTRLPVN